jgi:hypothetical protein
VLGSPRSLAAAALLLAGLAAACATYRPPARRLFQPIREEQKATALAAWEDALRRADSLPPARLLYDAKFGQGHARISGTLAVVVTPENVRATATGLFGSTLAQYENGALRLNGRDPLFLEPELLRGALAGVWRGGPPTLAGSEGRDCLLRWDDDTKGIVAEAVLDATAARLESLRVTGAHGEVLVVFSGAFDPWPQVLELSDPKSGQSLRLKRVAIEPIGK